MDYLKKYRFAVALAVVLAVINIVTISFILLSPIGAGFFPGRDRIRNTIEDELQLTELQKQHYVELRAQHFPSGDSLAAIQFSTMDSLFAMLKADTVNRESVQRQTEILGSIETSRYVGLFDHFRAIRALCTPEQQVKFDTVIVKVLQVIRDPRGMPKPKDKPSV